MKGSVPWPRFSTAVVLSMIVLLGMSTPSRAEESGEEEMQRNAVALFAGVTDDDKETAFTLGADYERRLSHLMGIGVLIDFVDEEEVSEVYILGLALEWEF